MEWNYYVDLISSTLMWEAGSMSCVDGRVDGMRQCTECNRHCYSLTSIVLFQITGNNYCKSVERLR